MWTPEGSTSTIIPYNADNPGGGYGERGWVNDPANNSLNYRHYMLSIPEDVVPTIGFDISFELPTTVTEKGLYTLIVEVIAGQKSGTLKRIEYPENNPIREYDDSELQNRLSAVINLCSGNEPRKVLVTVKNVAYDPLTAFTKGRIISSVSSALTTAGIGVVCSQVFPDDIKDLAASIIDKLLGNRRGLVTSQGNIYELRAFSDQQYDVCFHMAGRELLTTALYGCDRVSAIPATHCYSCSASTHQSLYYAAARDYILGDVMEIYMYTFAPTMSTYLFSHTDGGGSGAVNIFTSEIYPIDATESFAYHDGWYAEYHES